MFFKEMIGSFMMGKTFFYYRKSRKIGEKNRRDRLNTLLAQLAEENPWSAASEKRVDKAGILKLTVCFLKFHHG